MKILLDHNLDWRLGDQLSGHEVRTALEMTWDMLKNGALLAEAERVGFSVLITSDKGIKDQQSMKGRAIGVVVMRAPNNRLETHRTMIPEVARPQMAPAGLHNTQYVTFPTLVRTPSYITHPAYFAFPQLSPWHVWFLRAPRTGERVGTERIGQLRDDGCDCDAAMGEEEHQRLRRRSEQRDHSR